jgi:hypothetical protein
MLANPLPDPSQIVVTCGDSKGSWLISVGVPILTSLSAACVALFVVIKSARLAAQNDRKREEVSRIHETDVLAASLAAEIAGLMARYEMVGELIRKAAQPDELTFGFTEPRFNYFVIFESNASKIGLLDSEDVRQLVKFYVLAKGHFEDLITWPSDLRLKTEPAAQVALFNVIKETDSKLVALKNTLLGRLYGYTKEERAKRSDWYEAAEREAKKT